MPVLDMCRADPRLRDGLTDLAVTYYGETEPAARLSLKLFEVAGGRTRDRTLDLSRVKGTVRRIIPYFRGHQVLPRAALTRSLLSDGHFRKIAAALKSM
jgi:hypothetical protein